MKQILFFILSIFSAIDAMDSQTNCSKKQKIHSIKYGKILVTFALKNNLIKFTGNSDCLEKIANVTSIKKKISNSQEEFAREIAQACADARIECSIS